MQARIPLTVCTAAAIAVSLAAQGQFQTRELLAGAVAIDASESGVVVSVDEAGASGIGDGVVDRVFVAQRDGGRSFWLSGVGKVTYDSTRLTVRLNDHIGPLVFRIADKDPDVELEPGGDVESVFGIASMKPGLAPVSSQQSLDALRAVPMRPPSCSQCWSGGSGATSCSTSCGGTSCQVTCGGGYSACCNCTGYAQCTCCM